jgi:hypothetical protein
VLIDATYQPVDCIKNRKQRNEILSRDFNRLVADLKEFGRPPIVLVKINVHEVLYEGLRAVGFNVLNEEPFPFPSHGHQGRFAECFRQVMPCLGPEDGDDLTLEEREQIRKEQHESGIDRLNVASIREGSPALLLRYRNVYPELYKVEPKLFEVG